MLVCRCGGRWVTSVPYFHRCETCRAPVPTNAGCTEADMNTVARGPGFVSNSLGSAAVSSLYHTSIGSVMWLQCLAAQPLFCGYYYHIDCTPPVSLSCPARITLQLALSCGYNALQRSRFSAGIIIILIVLLQCPFVLCRDQARDTLYP